MTNIFMSDMDFDLHARNGGFGASDCGNGDGHRGGGA
jgi:hypothetical protein